MALVWDQEWDNRGHALLICERETCSTLADRTDFSLAIGKGFSSSRMGFPASLGVANAYVVLWGMDLLLADVSG